VVIPCFNGATTVGEQLDALAAQTYDGTWEVVVADNGMLPESRRFIEVYRRGFPRLRIVDARDQRGQAYAMNVGARAARGDAILFCDDDDVVGSGWVEALARALEEHEFVASHLETERLNEPWLHSVRRPARPGERLPYAPYLPHAGGGGMGIRRELFERVGGFDESMSPLHDTDLCVRVQLAGALLHYVPDAVVHIRFRTGFAATYRQGWAYGECNARVQARYATGLRSTRGWWKWPLRHWQTIAVSSARAFDRSSRARLAWALGWQVGRLRGSFRYRVPGT
jgi:GT2 family glycosyltransferase